MAQFKINQSNVSEAWRLMSVQARSDILKNAFEPLSALTHDGKAAMQVFNHLLEQGKHLDDSVMLTGATGESNELYIQARGKTLVVGCESASPMSILAQLLAGLLTGNEVHLHAPTHQDFCQQAVGILHGVGISEDVLTIANDSQTEVLLQMDNLAQVAVAGTLLDVKEVAAQVSQADGVLTQVIALTDLAGLSDVFNPDYLHRFTTERVKTINTTAIGGNASLLEMSVEQTKVEQTKVEQTKTV